jgi:hypothetical protein
MSKRKDDLRDWLKDKPAQLKWAWNYLWRKNFVVPVHGWDYETALRVIQALPLSSDALKSMRLAWNGYSSTVKRKRKSYGFTLSEEAGRQLRQIAGRQPQSHAVEKLLSDFDTAKKAEKDKIQKRGALEDRRKEKAIQDLGKIIGEWWALTEPLIEEWALSQARGELQCDSPSSEPLLKRTEALRQEKQQQFQQLLKQQRKLIEQSQSTPLAELAARLRFPDE